MCGIVSCGVAGWIMSTGGFLTGMSVGVTLYRLKYVEQVRRARR